MRFFHANDLTISAAAQLSHPAHHRTGPFDLVFALHSVGTTLACFYLAHALHLKPLAITNCLHGYLVFFTGIPQKCEKNGWKICENLPHGRLMKKTKLPTTS